MLKVLFKGYFNRIPGCAIDNRYKFPQKDAFGEVFRFLSG